MQSRHILSLISILSLLSSASISHSQSPPPEPLSLLAEPLSPERLGTITGVDRNIPEIAHQSTAKDGHLIVTGQRSDVWVLAGKFIELLPDMKVPGFTPVAISVFEDGHRTQTFGLEKSSGTPMIRIDPPTGLVNRKRVQVGLYDSTDHVRTVMECVLRSHVPGATPEMTIKSKGDLCEMVFAHRSELGGIALYLNGMYIGRMQDKAETVHLDTRPLPPGHYTVQYLPQTNDGVVLVPQESEINIAPRYTLETSDGAHAFTVHGDDHLILKITHTADCLVTKTRVYVSGEMLGEMDGKQTEISVPLRDVPSGKTTVDVIGVGMDGVTYAVESLPITIANEVWEARVYPSPEYAEIQSLLGDIAAHRKQMEEWYEKFSHEPFSHISGYQWQDFRSYDSRGRFIGWETYFRDIYTPGNAVGFKQKADKALTDMAVVQMKAGRLYAKLHMKQQARKMFRQVIQEMDTDSSLSASAKTEIQGLVSKTE